MSEKNNILHGKPEISYPCRWQFKIIGKQSTKVEEAIGIICEKIEYQISYSNASSSGKYVSFNVEIEVNDEEHRNTFFSAFQAHPDITMVI